MLVFPPQGHLVLQGERDGGGFGVDKLAGASGIPWQLEPARLRPVMGAIPPSPPDPQGCTPSSWSGIETAHDAESDAFPARSRSNGWPEGLRVARTSLGHCKDTLPVPAGQAAWPGRLTVPFPSANCLSTALGGCQRCVHPEKLQH